MDNIRIAREPSIPHRHRFSRSVSILNTEPACLAHMTRYATRGPVAAGTSLESGVRSLEERPERCSRRPPDSRLQTSDSLSWHIVVITVDAADRDGNVSSAAKEMLAR
ncbi:MAG: hypothetical protein MUE73_17565 [Planctomycetes bacterium]|nr:hypothetical protein [Planctomycetota bacterium]